MEAEPPLPETDTREKLLDCSPLFWNQFFDRKEQLDIDGDVFNVYFKGTQGPVFYLLHGGGYTGLTWSCFAEQLSAKIECRIIAPDLRAHGQTATKMRMISQHNDKYKIYLTSTLKFTYISSCSPLILIGHSMGGALAVHLVHAKLLPNVMAMAMVDVVEGSAISALSAMPNFLRGRPQQFASEEKAIRWCLQSGTTINKRAARDNNSSTKYTLGGQTCPKANRTGMAGSKDCHKSF
uniref:protein phosphatase methylesterase-1 n=1 Tax=Ditylenchus dipsaci TaxID=166011 RepID=A0A915DRD0_9BILA